MAVSGIYKTKQRSLIEEELKSAQGHITVEELTDRLCAKGSAVGRTTVYRSLERLVEEGKAQKYSAVGESSCYQFLEGKECCEHFHLKCTSCGRLIHIECDHIKELAEHIGLEHGFEVDKLKTVLYGKCEDCRKK